MNFLSKSTNKRIDEFGGSTTARARFASEIIKDVKKKCGEDYPAIVRISADEDLENGNNIIFPEDKILISFFVAIFCNSL